MTITAAQQATASAVQINQQTRMLKSIAAQLQNVLTNGAPANASQGLPGFTAADLAAVLGATEVTNLQAACTAVNAL